MDNKQIGSLIDGLKSGITVAGLNNRPELADVVISSESMDQTLAATAKLSLDTLNDTVEQCIEDVLGSAGMEDYDIGPAQKKAAVLVAALATNPAKTRENLRDLTPVSAQNVVGRVDGNTLGLEDMVDLETISTESFDGQTTNSAVYFSVVYNLLASKQDEFGEAFFPTIVIDPTSSGASIEARVINLYDEMTRSTSGSADKGKFNKQSIVKAITDPTILSIDKNKVVPVLRTENAEVLDGDLSFVNTDKGENITSAPIIMGKEISLLGVSQTDAQLAKGVMDNTDALDRRIQVENIYFDLSGKDASDADITETFKFNVSMLSFSNFTYSTQDHNKDLSLSFSTDKLILNTDSSKLYNGAGSEILAGLPSNYNIAIKLVMHGNGNTHYGDIALYTSEVRLLEVKDTGGNILEESDVVYAQIKAVIDTLKTRSYTVEAYTTNSNIRQRGQLVGVDIHNQIYTVPVRSGVTILKTIGNSNDTDNDATYLASQITFTGIKMALDAVNTLVNFGETLRMITLNGTVKDAEILGVARFFVDAYFNHKTIDLAATVDSIRSADRMEDIKGTLVNTIKDEVAKMYVESNYGVAQTVLNGNVRGKTSVIIGTDARIAQYLTSGDGKVNIGSDYDVTVVSTPNPLISGKMYVAFTDSSSSKNEKVNPLSFGCMFWSPELSLDVVANRGGSIVRELSTMNRHLHLVNTPILSILTVDGIEESLGKITANRHTV